MSAPFQEPEPLREAHRWLTDQIQSVEWALQLSGEAGELTGNRGMRWHRQRGYIQGLREARDVLRAAVRKMEAEAERARSLIVGQEYRVRIANASRPSALVFEGRVDGYLLFSYVDNGEPIRLTFRPDQVIDAELVA